MQRMQKLFIFDKYNGDVLFPRLLSQKDIKYNMYMFSTKSLYQFLLNNKKRQKNITC